MSRARAARDLPGHTIPVVALVVVFFIFQVWHYYFLGDDAFISFRYARNLVDGHGLVYNPGERVEGYTNFLWVMMMAGTFALGLAPEVVANMLGIASGALILVAIVHFSATSRGWADPLIWVAPLCLAVNRTFCAWSTGGLGTQFFSLLVFLAVLRFVAERRRSLKWPWLSSLLFALATLTRPEGALFFGVAALFFGIEAVALRRRRLLAIVPWLGLYVLIVGIHVAWRYAYYGYPLPNTFYAKVSGFWWVQSKVWLWHFAYSHNVLWFLPLLPVLLVLKRDFVTTLFGAVLAAYTAYLVYIGGDHHEYRFMTPALPYLYRLFQEAIGAVQNRWSTRNRSPTAPVPLGAVAALLLVGATFLSNGSRLPYDFQRESGISSLESIKSYAAHRIEEGKFLRGLVQDGLLTGREVIAVVGAGAVPYYSRLPTVDLYGLNDATVAHQEIGQRGIIHHEKMASYEYLVRRGVVMYEVMEGFLRPPKTRGGEGIQLYREVTSPAYHGPLRCVKVKGRYLHFATTLPDAEFRNVFLRFEIIF